MLPEARIWDAYLDGAHKDVTVLQLATYGPVRSREVDIIYGTAEVAGNGQQRFWREVDQAWRHGARSTRSLSQQKADQ